MATDAVAIRFIADTRKAQRGLKGLGKSFARLGSKAKGLSLSAGAVAGGLAAVAASAAAMGGALALATDRLATNMDEMGRAANVLGVTNESFQTLRFLAGKSRVDFSKLNAGLKRLQRNMLDSTTGNKRMAEAFQRLGIDVAESDGRLRNVMDVTRDLADAIRALGPGAEATGNLMLLLGRAGTETADIFLQGSGAFAKAESRLRSLNGFFSDEAIATASRYKEATSELSAAWEAFTAEILSEAIPAMTQLVEKLTDKALPALRNLKESVSSLPQFFADLGTGMLDAAFGADRFSEALDRQREREEAMARSRAKRRANIARGVASTGPVPDLPGPQFGSVQELLAGSAALEPAANSAGHAVGEAFGEGAVDGVRQSHAEFVETMGFGGGQQIVDALIEPEARAADERERIERELQAKLDAMRKREVDKARDRAREKQRIARQTADAQGFAAEQAFGAVATFAGIAQQAVEESYFGQTKAGKRAARAAFIVAKVAAIAQATVNTALAVTNALATPTLNPAVNAALAAGAAIAGAAQIGTIVATTIQGLADAGLAPGALQRAGLNQHTVLAVRNDEMVLDPKGTSEISAMLSMQRRQLELGAQGSSGQPVVVIAEMDGRRISRGLEPHMTRRLEDGHDFRRDVRFAGAA